MDYFSSGRGSSTSPFFSSVFLGLSVENFKLYRDLFKSSTTVEEEDIYVETNRIQTKTSF